LKINWFWPNDAGLELIDVEQRIEHAGHGVDRLLRPVGELGCLFVFELAMRNFSHRQYEVDGAGRDRAARHTVKGGLLRILGDDEPAFFADRLEPDAAVGAGPRQDDANRALAIGICQRTQEKIEGHPRAVRHLRLRKPQHAVAHRKIGLWRDDIHTVALDRHAIGGLRHLHCCVSTEQIDHHALMGRIEMRNQHKGDAGIRR